VLVGDREWVFHLLLDLGLDFDFINTRSGAGCRSGLNG
jgi:hypothetical protein